MIIRIEMTIRMVELTRQCVNTRVHEQPLVIGLVLLRSTLS
uniref:Uncharacterized protein n=1 Tax=Ascaris lumbricoides TaxID=6252 RepID=A0A0M3HWJ9_ASCLU